MIKKKLLIKLCETAKIYVKTFVKWLSGHPVKRLKLCIDVSGDTFEQYMWNTLLWNKTWNVSLSCKKKIAWFGQKMGEIYNFIFVKWLLGPPVLTCLQFFFSHGTTVLQENHGCSPCFGSFLSYKRNEKYTINYILRISYQFLYHVSSCYHRLFRFL